MSNIQDARQFLIKQGFVISDLKYPCFIHHPTLKWTTKSRVPCFNDRDIINFAYMAYVDQELKKISDLSISLEDDTQCVIQTPLKTKTFCFAMFQRRCGYIYISGRLIWSQRKKYLQPIIEDILNEYQFYADLENMGMEIKKGTKCTHGDGLVSIAYDCYKTLTPDFTTDYQKMTVEYYSLPYRTVVNPKTPKRQELNGLISVERINQLKILM